MTMLVEGATTCWVAVCNEDDVETDRGVAVLVGAHQMALFRLRTGELYAIDNRDPFSGANVLARGIVGSRDGTPKVASPMYKQTFNLQTGQCFEDPSITVATYPVRIHDGSVFVGHP